MKLRLRNGKEKVISNNIVALLAILFAVISLVGNVKVYKETEKLMPVGYSIAEAQVSLVISGNQPAPRVLFPNGCEVLNGTITVIANATDPEGDETVSNVTFYYSSDYGETGYEGIGVQNYDGDTSYNATWNTSNVSDGLYYKIRAIAEDITGLTGDDTSQTFFAVNNIDEEPDWTDFKTVYSTNLTALVNNASLGEWAYVQGLMLGNRYGMVNFSGRTLNVDSVNLSRHFNITIASISLDSTALPCLNVPAYLHFFDVNLTSPRILRNGGDCPGALCTVISNSGGDVVIWVSYWTKYEVTESATLSIWDVTDKDVYNGNQSRHRRELTQFYGNLTAAGTPINESSVNCYIWFNTSDDEWDLMEFQVSGLYEHQRQFNRPGIYRWNVTCNSTVSQYFIFKANDTVNISNRAPHMTSIFPNVTMEEDRELQYVDLDDYFVDPDGDSITYNTTEVANIVITIHSNNVIVIAPEQNWFGNRSFRISALDEFGLSNNSNTIYITVTDVPEDPGDLGGEGDGGGGGGGGYTETEYLERPECTDRWQCTAWSACEYRWPDLDVDEINDNDGLRIRTCIDVNSCNYWWKKPNETMYCFYEPACNDLIKNQQEEKVDCGGPNCDACPTCEDSIQNQNETGVDCGGPCKPCPSCYDGIQNQEEEGVDCGGSCRSCVTIERPAGFDWIIAGLMVLMLSVLFFTTYIFAKPYIVRISLGIMKLREKLRAEEIPEKSMLDYEAETLSKFDAMLKKLERGDLQGISDEFNVVFREFLKFTLKIDYEFTYEELIEELKKKKLPGLLKLGLSNYVSGLIEIQYGRRKLTKQLLRDEIHKAKEIVSLVIKNLPKEEVVPKKGRPKVARDNIRQVYKLIVDANKSLARKDMSKARKDYNKMKELFDGLSKKQKKEVYSKLSRLRKAIERGHKKQ